MPSPHRIDEPSALPFLSRNGHCVELSFADGGGAETEKIRSESLVDAVVSQAELRDFFLVGGRIVGRPATQNF